MNSPIIVSSLLEQNKAVYDSGQTEYFQYSHYPSGWLTSFLPSNSDISKQWEQYQNSIREAVRQQAFDAIIITPREHTSGLQDLQEQYFMVDTIGICMFHASQCTPLEIWEPKFIDGWE